VVDDYYQKGKEINKSLARDSAAARHGLHAGVRLDAARQEVVVQLSAAKDQPLPERLEIRWLHATREGFDRTQLLIRSLDGRYRGAFPSSRPATGMCRSRHRIGACKVRCVFPVRCAWNSPRRRPPDHRRNNRSACDRAWTISHDRRLYAALRLSRRPARLTHCLGMCGGIVSALTFGLRDDLRRSPWTLGPYLLAYNAGRISSYVVAGLIAGAVGASAFA